ncbi:PREDICTED: uncharacterized protein LOC109333408 [Lupinus angustifolius]|uniref:uncharacterized protein LOC109333408 n=1 Tax=Lupinus angustifolius TaxID=3871 RepID=UPI00092E77FA|nr:PREDICTED: uncharacterized protein LOC109333408 [Lupinus angustifolius]
MSLPISNFLNCPNLLTFPPKFTSSSFLRLPKTVSTTTVAWRNDDRRKMKMMICNASASAAGTSNPDDADFNPYQVLGVNPIEKFDAIKAKYAKKRKEAEINGDEATASRLEKAYDKLMMAQLTNRKKGVTFGSFKVSKDIKYADKQPIVPWGPRFSKSSTNDIRINLAVSAVFTAWILVKRSAEYKPLQFLAFAAVYRLFEKLKSFESPVAKKYTEEGEDTGEGLRMGKRLLRALALVFGCVAFASLAFTVALNVIEYASGSIPAIVYNSQELIITTSSAVLLYILASYYR